MEQVSTQRVGRRRGAVAIVAALAVSAFAGAFGATPAGAATKSFNNATSISIPDSGNANPYPSTINVSGMGPKLESMKVVIRNTTHGCAKDLDVLLVGPTGVKTILFSDNGHAALLPSCSDLNKTSITIDDSCPDFGNAVPGGANICVRPSNNNAIGHQGDNWGTIGNGAAALNLSTFAGTNPNGAWNLYVVDDSGDDSGSFAGGWGLQLTTANDAPQADPKVVNVNKGTATPVALTGTDPDGDALTCVAPTATAQGKGTLTGSGCSRTFTANARTSGTDSFTYKVQDPDGLQSPNASVVFNIQNRLPVATDKVISVGRGQKAAIALTGVDPDPGESFALTCTPTTGTTGLGTVTGSGCNVNYQAGSTIGTDSIAFTVNDGFGGTDAGTVTINVVDPELPGCTSGDSKNARYVCRVYLDLLGRAADPSGKAFWLRKVDNGESRVGIIRKYQTTAEYRRGVVDDVYKAFLQRAADSGGREYWAEQIRKGANPDQIRSQVIGSSEYFNKAGGSNDGFAAAIHQQVLRRPATSAEINSVKSQLASGKSRQAIATALLATREGDTATVQAVYERYLRRTPPASEVTFWVNRLQTGTTELKIVESTVSSNEYFNQS